MVVDSTDADRVGRQVAVAKLLASVAVVAGLLCAVAAVLLPEMGIAWAAVVAACGSSAPVSVWVLGRIVRRDEW